MPTIWIGIDNETYQRLVESAEMEKRPAARQVEVLLMRALGTFPSLVLERMPEGGSGQGKTRDMGGGMAAE